MGSRDEFREGQSHSETDGGGRISELKHEKDELRHYVEQLPGLQNIFGSIDFVSLMQGRRSSGLEKVLEEYTQKLEICQRENNRLQEELSEVYIIKSKFAEQSKTEAEKCSSLEKEVKFYQTQMAAAFSDRDRSLLEIKAFQKREAVAIKKINELQKRLDLVTSEYGKEQDKYNELQKHQETFQEEISIYRELVARFWKVREQEVGISEGKTIMTKAVILLQDPEGLWSYGEREKSHLHDQQIIQANEEWIAYEEDFKENDVQEVANSKGINAVSHYREQLFCFADLLTAKVQQIHSANKNLKDDVNFFIKEEKSRILSLLELCKQFRIQYSGDWNTKKDVNDEVEVGKYSSKHDMPKEEQKVESGKKKEKLATSLQEPTDDIAVENITLAESNEASEFLRIHQEDIHGLVSEVPEISLLKQQLLQVTSEKVNALMRLEQLQKESLMFQDQQRGKTSNQKDMFWRRGHRASSHGDKNMRSGISEGTGSQGYLKHLWRHGWVLNTPTKSLVNVSSASTIKESDHEEVAKLRADNAALRESLWCIHNLCKSVKHLRRSMIEAGIESKASTEVYVRDVLNALDNVISEALHLEVALKFSLPSSDVEWDKVESSIVARVGNEVVSQVFSDGETANDDEVDTVAFWGLEMVRLVLYAAKLKRMFIQISRPE